MRHRLGYALSWRFVLASTLPILVFGFVARSYVTGRISEDIELANASLSQAIAREESAHLHQPLAVLQHVASALRAGDPSPREIDRLLGSAVAPGAHFASVFLLGPDGLVESVALSAATAGHPGDFEGIDLSALPSVRTAKATEGPVWTDAFFSIVGGELALSLTLPAGQRTLVGTFSIDYLARVTSQVQPAPGVHALVIDRKGTVLFSADRTTAERRVNLRHVAPVRQGLEGIDGTQRFSWESRPHLGSVSQIAETGWLVLVAQDVDEAFAPVRRFETYLLLGLGGAVIIALLWGLAMTSRLTRPLTLLGKTARAVASGDYRVDVPEQRHEELEELAVAFRDMANDVASREDQLEVARTTLEHVAHTTGRAVGERLFEALATTVNDVMGSQWCVVLESVESGGTKPLAVAKHGELLLLDALSLDPRLLADTATKDATQSVVEARAPDVDPSSGSSESFDLIITPFGREERLGVLLIFDPVDKQSSHPPPGQSGSFLSDRVSTGRLTLSDASRSLLAILANRAGVELVRLQSERALRASEARYRDTFEQASIGICQLDLDLRVTWTNTHFATMFGYESPAAMVALPIDVLALVELRSLYGSQLTDMVLDPQAALTAKQRFCRPDGSCFWGTISVSMLRDEDEIGTQYVAMVEDISESVRAEEERERLGARLQHAERMEAIGQLAGGIAHDFNNLLAAIMGHAELLMLELSPGTDSSESAHQILKSTKRAADLTGQLLAFSRRGQFERTHIDMHELINDVVGLLSRSTAPNIELLHECRASLALVVGDPSQLQNALINLAVNGRDAMPDGGKLCVRTSDRQLAKGDPSGLPAGSYLCVSIEDKGVGIPSEILDKIFQPFFTTKPVGKGTGLGLASVYGCAEAHGGIVQVRSEVGVGTTFELLLPTMDSAFLRSPSSPEHRPEHLVTLGLHVAVIDDEEPVRGFARRALESLGCHVTEFGRGQAGVDALRAAPDELGLVVLDLIMPVMSGRETFTELRRLVPNLPVVFITGYAEQTLAQSLLEEPLVDLVLKPFTITELSRAVSHLASARKQL